MKLRLITALLVYLFCTSFCLSAQAEDTGFSSPKARERMEKNKTVKRGFGLHIMPTSFVNLLPRFRAGLIYKPSLFSFLVDVEYGSDFTMGAIGLPNDTDFNFIGIRPEVRFDPIPTYRPFYVGLEVAISEFSRRKDGVFSRPDGSQIEVRDALQERFRIGGIFKAGIHHLAWERMVLDMYLGIGGAYREVTYTDAASFSTAREDALGPDELFGRNLFREGDRFVPELAFGIRLGYWFNY
jgi:hypothetical protein